jgi:hypothetical protein
MESVVKVCLVLVVAMSMAAYAGTVAQWNFDDGAAGQAFTPADAPGGSGYSADLVAGYALRGWNPTAGPSWTDDTATGSGLAMRNNSQDGYSYDSALLGWTPAQFTIEATFKMNNINNWRTLIGRRSADAAGGSYSALYFQKTWDNYFRFDFATVGGERFEVTSIASGLIVEADKWYSMAAASDGTTLSLYVNDIAAGTGWTLAGQTDISGAVNSAMAAAAGDWLFGTGWFGGNLADKIDGTLDDIRFSDTALTTQELITVVPEPATLVMLSLGAVALLRKRK